MSFLQVFLIAIGLSMDAFAVSICKGLSLKKTTWKDLFYIGLWFGGFQALMPAIGYFFGNFFTEFISESSQRITFAVLLLIGGSMIKESFKKEQCIIKIPITVKSMFGLGIATSVDALAVGVSFAFMKINIVWTALLIGFITFILSVIGVKVGSIFGLKYKSKAEFAGGLILVGIGFNILIN